MKIILFFLFTVTSLLGFSQSKRIVYQTAPTPYQWKWGTYDSVLKVPYGATPRLSENSDDTSRPGALFFNTTNKKLYVWDGGEFVSSSSSSALTTVPDITSRDSIPSGDRYEGMIVYVSDVKKYYSLKGGITNSDWVEFTSGGSGGGGVFIDNF